jgi:hypothetical protein
MVETSYSVERHDTTGELYLIEWTEGIDAPTGLCGPISEEAFRSTETEGLVESASFAAKDLDWYAAQPWTEVARVGR